jgi:hypothetical protein
VPTNTGNCLPDFHKALAKKKACRGRQALVFAAIIAAHFLFTL